MLEVESALVSVALWLPEVAGEAMKLSPAPLQKHSLGGYTIYMPRRTTIGGKYRFAARYERAVYATPVAPLANEFLLG